MHPAVGYTVNMEMPPECGNKKYELVFDGIIQKILMQFGPDQVIIECGFDAYYKDPLAQMNLTLEGYYDIIHGLSAKWKRLFNIFG